MTTETNNNQMKMLIVILLVINALLGIYIGFFKKDALWLETLKAGGAQNMSMARQLYASPAYQQQQKATLDQILGSMNQAGQQAPAVTAQPEATLPTAQPTVTQ
ncbi:MAG: hypothetical protein NTY80_03075 [candidate division SR1 bacterium]|nr:hypothetical protein [candidate division SR1 bacterium]